VSRPLARYTPCRRFLLLTLVAIFGALLSAWMGLRWAPSWIAAGLFAVSGALLLVVTLRPSIEIHETHLAIGRRVMPWSDIRRIDQTGWNAPLAVHLTLADQQRILLVYPGDLDSSTSLLRHLRRYSRQALLDGMPYRQFWGEPAAANDEPPKAPKYPLMRPEDEEEIERMFQRLKSVGRLDGRGADDK
jgi:Protein of unknown function (DUF3093)